MPGTIFYRFDEDRGLYDVGWQDRNGKNRQDIHAVPYLAPNQL